MKKITLLFFILMSYSSLADDIELYIGNTAARTATKPQVLLIFDNSGSMKGTVKIKVPYNHNTVYDAISPFTRDTKNYIYYAKGGIANKPMPDDPLEKRKVVFKANSCQTAISRLQTVGFYTGYVREYTFTGSSGSWTELPEFDATNVKMIDCWDDIRLSADSQNNIVYDDNEYAFVNGSFVALPDGYPIDGQGTPSAPEYYTDNLALTNTNFGTGEVVTLFADNYLRWSHNGDLGTERKAKMDIAKEAVTALIDSAPTVDFALEVFNSNGKSNNKNGGRITFGFEDLTPSKSDELKAMVNALSPDTSTPLCESLYEAYRYFAGKGVYFGDDDSNGNPKRDTSVESNGTYISPFKSCSNEISVILMTDGEPWRDHGADSLVKDLVPAPTLGESEYYDSYLPALARWMKNNDINSLLDGVQTSTLYTIGFKLGKDKAVNLLKEAADEGGGKYYDAEDPSALLSSLQSALIEILKVNTSFTAPSVASNNFDRTKTLNAVYYAMFSPNRGPRWQGNLKKLRVASTGVVDRTGSAAIEINGSIKTTAKTYWSTSNTPDGGEVAEGGVAEMLRAKSPSDRVLYSNLGTNNALVAFNRDNAQSVNGFNSSAELALEMGVAEDQLDNYLLWAQGVDVDDDDQDGSTTDMRPDVFGDPLHSKPVVINYGGTATAQDIRIIIGTNAGALHMFDDQGDTVTEDWAFMPKEFFKNIASLKNNYTSSDKVYGIDGTPVSFIYDKNNNGTVEVSDGDKAWVFFGLRRGGSSYYGLDVTNPSSPELLWHINQDTAGFSELGESWSTPRVVYSRINISDDGNVAKPAVIFSAGYSTTKDLLTIGTSDPLGRGIFMVDAENGSKLWSLTPSTTPAFPGTDSIASAVATMDSDSDGFVDRLYIGDTGGHVWRVDMFGIDKDEWQVTKLASLGSEDVLTEDRRFFAEPTIARALITETVEHIDVDSDGNQVSTIHQYEVPYDAILLGSGDRTKPLTSNTNDKLFMIKDQNILTKKFSTVPDVITMDDLYDYTDDPFGNVSDEGRSALAVAVSQKQGWYIDLLGNGEKSVAKPEAIAGVAYFNSFQPASSNNSCQLAGGEAFLYAMDLALGVNIYQWRKLQVGNSMQDGITLISLPVDDSDPHNSPSNAVVGDPLAILAGQALGLCDANGNCDGVKLKTMRTHLYVTEKN